MERIVIAGATLAVSPSTLRALQSNPAVRNLILEASGQLDEFSHQLPELREMIRVAQKQNPNPWEVSPKVEKEVRLIVNNANDSMRAVQKATSTLKALEGEFDEDASAGLKQIRERLNGAAAAVEATATADVKRYLTPLKG